MLQQSLTGACGEGDTAPSYSQHRTPGRNTLKISITVAGFFAACTIGFCNFAQAQDANTGRNIASNCANCHGTLGRSQGGMPALAGRADVLQLMKEFKEGKRPATIMHQLAKGYSDEQIALVAAYFAQQKAR